MQLGQGIALAEESYARTTAIDSALWKPLDGQYSVSSIKGVWLGSNPKRALLRLVGAKNMAATGQAQARSK